MGLTWARLSSLELQFLSYFSCELRMSNNAAAYKDPRYTAGHLPLKVVFHPRLSSTKGRLPPKAVFHQKFSFTEGRLPPEVVSTQGRLPLKVVFYQRSSSTKVCLAPKVFFY